MYRFFSFIDLIISTSEHKSQSWKAQSVAIFSNEPCLEHLGIIYLGHCTLADVRPTAGRCDIELKVTHSRMFY